MTDYPDAVEIIDEACSFVTRPDTRDIFAALLEAAHSDSVLIEKVKCKECDGKLYVEQDSLDENDEPWEERHWCPTCNRQGHSYRMSVPPEPDEPQDYDSRNAHLAACGYKGENGSGFIEPCIRRVGHPGFHIGLGSE